MSWSIGAIGRPAAVIKQLESDFSKYPCAEPEETVRQAAGKAIIEAVKAQNEHQVVKVTASGSMGFDNYTAKTGVFNSLSVSIEPIHGFVE